MKNLRKGQQYGVYVFLIGLILLLTVVKIRYGFKGSVELVATNLVQPTMAEPTATVTNTPNQNKDYPVWKELPYKGNGFVVDRYVAPLTLAVKIEKGDKTLVEKEVIKWLEGLGEGQDGHKFVWE